MNKNIETEHREATLDKDRVQHGRMVSAGTAKQACLKCFKHRHCDEMGLCRKCYKWVRDKTQQLMDQGK